LGDEGAKWIAEAEATKKNSTLLKSFLDKSNSS
jgi:hypothetical protein